MELSDAAVVQRVLGGDSEAYRILVERYHAQFGRYAVALVGDRDGAADAMQEAFIRAYRSLATCRDPGRFGAWFFRILTNQCHDVRGGRVSTVDIAEVDPAAGHRTDAALEHGELADLLESALAELTPEQREAFLLKHVEGRSYEEMAGLTGVGVDALKMRVHRARDTLKEILGARL